MFIGIVLIGIMVVLLGICAELGRIASFLKTIADKM